MMVSLGEERFFGYPTFELRTAISRPRPKETIEILDFRRMRDNFSRRSSTPANLF